MNNYGILKNTYKKKHEKYVVVMKAHGVCMKGITIKGKASGKSGGVSSFVKPKDSQDGNEDVNQDMPDNLYNVLVTDFPTQRKDEQVSKLYEQDVILNVVPLQMIVPVDVPKTKAKDIEIKKENTPKGKSVRKKRKVEEKTLKRKLV